MKATGIVRRIDDLGRVVIPKEIRRTMRIREGDPLEIYTSREGEVIFKKYSLLEGVEDFSSDLCETISRTVGGICAVTDRDTVISVSGGGKRELLGRRLSPELEQLLEARQAYHLEESGPVISAADNNDRFVVQAAAPILSEGDLAGAILLISGDPVPAGETACKLTQAFSAFLGRHLAG